MLKYAQFLPSKPFKAIFAFNFYFSENVVSNQKTSLSYKDAGVDIDAGTALVERIKGVAKRTKRPEVMGGLGGFGALCQLPTGYKEPLLVAGTDGVGTKLRLAIDLKKHDTVGIDLVAMCVNDLIVQGAEPLFFLDYYATGKLDVDVAADVVTGIGEGCLLSNCSLIGGETAEMPGMYEGDDYDIAGFCVGVVEKSEVIDGTKVAAGDALIAVASSGPHSNGYSLVRKILEVSKADTSAPFGDSTLGDTLLTPTKIYVKSTLELIKNCPVHAHWNLLKTVQYTLFHISLVAVFGKIFHAYYQQVVKRLLMVKAGNGLLFSTGYKKMVTLKQKKCTVHSTVVLA